MSRFWSSVRIPSAAQRFDKLNAGGHATPRDLHSRSLIRQRDAFRSDDFQIGCDTTFVAVGGEFYRTLGSRNGLLLRTGFLFKDA